MGKLKELLDKQKAGTISDAEQKQLDALLAKADEDAENAAVNTDKDPSEDEDDAEQAVNDLADKLAEGAMSRLEQGLDKVLKGIEKHQEPVTVKAQSGFIIDKRLGKKSVDELAEIKVAVPNREGKKHKEVSMKTMHFIEALVTQNVEKLQVLVEGTGSRGGFLVPEDFANLIVEDIRDQSVMRQIADVITTTSDTLHLPNLAGRPKAAWRAEAAVKNTSTVDFGETVLTPYSLATIVSLSNELVADASLGVNGSIVNYVSQVMAQSLAEKEETAFWVGSGSGQPTGIDSYSFRTVTAGSSDASRADALISAYMRTPQGYRSRGVFAANSATIERALQYKDTNGNYLLRRLGEGPVLTLLGRPLYEVNDLGGGKAFFGDFGYYKIVDREGIQVRVSDEATVAGVSGFERNITHVRVEKRVDGELTLTAPITELANMGNP